MTIPDEGTATVVDFSFVIDKAKSLILFGRLPWEDTLEPMFLSLEDVTWIDIDTDYGDLVINFTSNSIVNSNDKVWKTFAERFVNNLTNSLNISLHIKKLYRFENIPELQNYNTPSPPEGSDF
jgi:hypothetical protein